MAYWGMDISEYPGDNVMKDLKDQTYLKWTGFYLAPTPYRTDVSWMNKLSTLKAQGWKTLPIYLGKQLGDSNLTFAKGKVDADDAIAKAKSAGFTNGAYIYFDVETGGLLSDEYLQYLGGFFYGLTNEGTYSPGVYCSYKETADQIKANLNWNQRYWVYKKTYTTNPFGGAAPNPSESGVSYATAWQLALDLKTTVAGHSFGKIDFSSSTTSNPANT